VKLIVSKNSLEVGLILSLVDGIVHTTDVDMFYNELLTVGGLIALVLNLHALLIGCVLLGRDDLINQGDFVERIFIELTLDVGFWLVGRVVDPFCKFLDYTL
jgi:F0F1-type ATP synthase alpha subunit